jgi:hypothetical protein
MSRLIWGGTVAACITFGATAATHAYNHDQHTGLVAIGYKAMVAASLEKGCGSPIDFGEGDVPPSLRTLPANACLSDAFTCQARWTTFLDEIDRSIAFLRSVNSSLTPPVLPPQTCDDPRSGTNTLGEVVWAVDRYYNRDDGSDREYCGIPPDSSTICSAPVGLCDENSIYRDLAPHDHTGDVLGYWATWPDDDPSVSALGFKPTSAGGLGKTINSANEFLEDAATALLAPAACAFHFLRTGNFDCLDQAKSLADSLIPLEELHGAMPVFGAIRDADALAGLWHFQDLVEGATNPCDDHRGILYEEAGPARVPDALDVAFVIIGDLTGLTLNFDASSGPERFNITNPEDGDQPSCERGRVDWEFQTLGHTDFSPLDNLALYGWRRFATPSSYLAQELGWPLHAIGDAVAPHHVAGTTGWGHRPYEDAADLNWRKIIYIEPPLFGDQKRLQYEQLRTILTWAFHYMQVLDEKRAERPSDTSQQEIPIRALITEVGADTLAQTTEPITGAPKWPFNPLLSVPYVLDAGIKTQVLTEFYGDQASIQGTRALLERGAGAAAAFLSSTWRVDGTVLPTGARCNSSEPHNGFFRCSAQTTCNEGCCEPFASSDCDFPCQNSDECGAGLICQANCCVVDVR